MSNDSQNSLIRGKRTPRFHALLRPDAELEVEVLVAEGDRVVTRWTGTGTHEGELMGIPATGNRVTVAEMDISPTGVNCTN